MKRKIYGLIMFALLLSLGFTSCLKDDKIDNQEYGLINLNANKIIEIPAGTKHEISFVLLPEGMKELTIGEVRLAAESPASEDVVVSLTKDRSAEIIDTLPLFPLEDVTLPSTVTIPKGERSAPLTVTVNTEKLLGTPQYFAVSIASVNKQGYVISGNYGYLKLNLKVKNKYDGMYRTKGYFIHPTLGKSEFDDSGEDGEPLSSTGPASVEMPWAGDRAIPVTITVTSETMDVDGKTVSKVLLNMEDYPNNNGQFDTDPDGKPMNYYDPSTKTFELYYYYNTAAKRIIRETLIYEGPRK